MENEICVVINKVPGGYIVDLPTGRVIETSLNKVMSTVKSVLATDVGNDSD